MDKNSLEERLAAVGQILFYLINFSVCILA
jgi:hypothetical protein